MKYTYAFLGQGRTGTTSLWRMLRDHPQIAVSIEKEHYQDSFTTLEEYHKGFMIDKNTKVLLNGRGNAKDYCIDVAKNIKDQRVCCIYALRNQKTRLISYYDMINKVKKRRSTEHEDIFCEDGRIDYIKLQMKILQDIHEYAYLREIEHQIGKENIFVFHMVEMEDIQDFLYDFLEIDQANLRFPKLNSSAAITPTIETIKDKRKISEFVDDLLFNKSIQDIADKQIDLIYERYRVR